MKDPVSNLKHYSNKGKWYSLTTAWSKEETETHALQKELQYEVWDELYSSNKE